MAQLIKSIRLLMVQVMISWFRRSSPMSGSLLTAWSLLRFLFLSFWPSAMHTHMHFLSFSKKKRNKQPDLKKKNGKGTWVHIFPKKIYRWPTDTWNITSHQGNINQTTVRYYLTPVRLAIIKKPRNKNCWQGCREKGTLVHCEWKCKLMQPLWKTAWRFLKKLKIITIWSSNFTSFIQRKKPPNWRDICTPMFTEAWFLVAKIWKQFKYLICEWIKM